MDRRTFFAACGAGAAAVALPAVPKRQIGVLVHSMHVDTSAFSAGLSATLRVVGFAYARTADDRWAVTVTGEGGGASAKFSFNISNQPDPHAMMRMIGQEIRGFQCPPDSFSWTIKSAEA